jgi:hypothetical protein
MTLFFGVHGSVHLILNVYTNIQQDATDNILVLLQDLYMFRLPAVPIIRSTILQLTVTAITYIKT